MILTSHIRVGWLPMALAVIGMVTSSFVLGLTILHSIRTPIINVPGSLEFRDNVKPMKVDEDYTKAVARAFCLRMQAYNPINFVVNRKVAMKMIDDGIMNQIQSNNAFMITVIDNFSQSAQVSIISITSAKIGDRFWETKTTYRHEVFDGGAPRIPEERVMTLVLREMIPKTGDIYAVRVVNIDDVKVETAFVPSSSAP